MIEPIVVANPAAHVWRKDETITPTIDGVPIPEATYSCICGHWETTAPPGDSGGPPAGFLQHVHDAIHKDNEGMIDGVPIQQHDEHAQPDAE